MKLNRSLSKRKFFRLETAKEKKYISIQLSNTGEWLDEILFFLNPICTRKQMARQVNNKRMGISLRSTSSAFTIRPEFNANDDWTSSTEHIVSPAQTQHAKKWHLKKNNETFSRIFFNKKIDDQKQTNTYSRSYKRAETLDSATLFPMSLWKTRDHEHLIAKQHGGTKKKKELNGTPIFFLLFSNPFVSSNQKAAAQPDLFFFF